jgi:hypothetical protein
MKKKEEEGRRRRKSWKAAVVIGLFVAGCISIIKRVDVKNGGCFKKYVIIGTTPK